MEEAKSNKSKISSRNNRVTSSSDLKSNSKPMKRSFGEMSKPSGSSVRFDDLTSKEDLTSQSLSDMPILIPIDWKVLHNQNITNGIDEYSSPDSPEILTVNEEISFRHAGFLKEQRLKSTPITRTGEKTARNLLVDNSLVIDISSSSDKEESEDGCDFNLSTEELDDTERIPIVTEGDVSNEHTQEIHLISNTPSQEFPSVVSSNISKTPHITPCGWVSFPQSSSNFTQFSSNTKDNLSSNRKGEQAYSRLQPSRRTNTSSVDLSLMETVLSSDLIFSKSFVDLPRLREQEEQISKTARSLKTAYDNVVCKEIRSKREFKNLKETLTAQEKDLDENKKKFSDLNHESLQLQKMIDDYQSERNFQDARLTEACLNEEKVRKKLEKLKENIREWESYSEEVPFLQTEYLENKKKLFLLEDQLRHRKMQLADARNTYLQSEVNLSKVKRRQLCILPKLEVAKKAIKITEKALEKVQVENECFAYWLADLAMQRRTKLREYLKAEEDLVKLSSTRKIMEISKERELLLLEESQDQEQE